MNLLKFVFRQIFQSRITKHCFCYQFYTECFSGSHSVSRVSLEYSAGSIAFQASLARIFQSFHTVKRQIIVIQLVQSSSLRISLMVRPITRLLLSPVKYIQTDSLHHMPIECSPWRTIYES